MTRKLFEVSRRYQDGLLAHLKAGGKDSLEIARGLGNQAMTAGLQVLDLAKLHERTLVAEVLPGCPAGKHAALIKRAGVYFAVAITPIEKTHHSAIQAGAQLRKFIEALSQRSVELAASNLELSQEVAQRKCAEEQLKKSERHYSHLLEESERLRLQLRRLSQRIVSAHEDERKKISRELHDVVAQALTGINLGLVTLKTEALLGTKGLEAKITRTQRLVEKSVDIVHRFARELRPAALDDLGLIPALHTSLKEFTQRYGVRTRLTAFAGVEGISVGRRTVLFRVAQEALANAARHAHASLVEVSIQKKPEGICMSIRDDGRSFDPERVARGKGAKRLGLLGMKERLEMVGGRLDVESAPGKGTTIHAWISSGYQG